MNKELTGRALFLGELDPMMKGLQDLKYSPDENTKEELAKNYKEDGNFQFKLKKYRLSIAAYTEGIKCKSDEVIQETSAYLSKKFGGLIRGKLKMFLFINHHVTAK